jgi:Secretion system C-terminal sorting domain/Domain of unknown function (DUF4957)
MRRSALIVLGIALFNLLLASVINVDPGRNSLYDALVAASEGDTLVLTQSADYVMDSILVVDKTITIKAAEGLDTKPVIKNVSETLLTRYHIQIVDGGHLRLDGLEFDGMSDSDTPVKYCITTTEKMLVPYSLFVNDCVMHDFVIDEEGRFFRSYAETYADSVVFTNCLLYNAGRQGICMKDADNTVGYFEISYSTMFNVYHEGIYVQGDSVIFRVNHCTFDNLGYASMDMVRPRFINDTEIINTIFSNVPEPQSRALLVYGPANVDYVVFHNIGTVDIHNTAICQFGDSVYFDVDPQYVGREYGDFQLSNTSPFLTFSTDGSVLGDPNWGQYSGVLPRKIYVGNERNALSDSLKIAKDSDILELTQSGEYFLDSILIIDKTITIKAAEGLESKPVLKNVNNSLSTISLMEIQTGGNLYLDGLELDGLAAGDSAADFLIKTAESMDENYKLVVKDCILHDIDNGSEGAFFKSYANTYADSIVFKNCIMYNCAGIGLDMIDADNIVDYFELSNSTMYDIGDMGFTLQGSYPIILVDHCNFDNLGAAGNGMINPAVLDVEIVNCIFSHAPDSTDLIFTYYYYGKIDYNNFYKVGPIQVWKAGDNPVGDNNIYGVDPLFADQVNNDYTLPEASPMYYAGENEVHLGDSRWAVNAPLQIYHKFHIPAYQNSIYDSLLAAGDRDTLILTEAAEYLLDSTLYINKTIVLKAAEGLASKPVLKNVKPGYTDKSILQIQTNGNLYLEGLDLDGMADSDRPAKCLIRTDEEIDGYYNLYVNDCVLHDIVYFDMGNFFRGYSKAKGDTVKFTDCILYNSGKEGIRIKDADNTVRYFEMSNCTMYRTKTESIYIQGNEVVFRVDHCTFNDIAWIHADMIRPRYVIDAEITNSIFANTPDPHSRVILLYGSSLMSHNDFYNVGGITKVVVHDSSSYRFGDNMLFEVDPMFANPDSGDFTLLSGSQLYGMASDGEAMGDLRWATQETLEDTTALAQLPDDYTLHQNYPNPFNPLTTIDFSIPQSEYISMDLFNVSGKKVMTMVNAYMPAGNHKIILNAPHLSSGIYFYSMKAGEFSAVKKLTLLK